MIDLTLIPEYQEPTDTPAEESAHRTTRALAVVEPIMPHGSITRTIWRCGECGAIIREKADNYCANCGRMIVSKEALW